MRNPSVAQGDIILIECYSSTVNHNNREVGGSSPPEGEIRAFLLLVWSGLGLFDAFNSS
jgi:hypothetical protein